MENVMRYYFTLCLGKFLFSRFFYFLDQSSGRILLKALNNFDFWGE